MGLKGYAIGLALLSGAPGVAQALMPPHVNSASPSSGTLVDRLVVLRGYTLSMDPEVSLTGGDGRAVDVTADSRCTWEGTGNMPGARQQRCALVVKITGELKGGETLTLSVLGNTYTYTVPAEGLRPLAPGEGDGDDVLLPQPLRPQVAPKTLAPTPTPPTPTPLVPTPPGATP